MNKNRYWTLRSRSAKFHMQLEKRSVRTLAILVFTVIAISIVGVGIGDTWVHPWEVIRAICGQSSGDYDFVLYRLRFPRAVVGLLAGAALGMSGAILQGIIRNPLASPDIIGITGGASVAAVLFLSYGSTFLHVSIQWLPVAAIVGALIVSGLIYMLSWKNGVTPMRLVLIGIGVAAAMSAITTFMLVMSSTFTAGKVYVWLTGSVYGATWSGVYSILPVCIIAIPLLLYFARSLNSQELGDDVAAGLGVSVQKHRFVLLLLSVILAGSAVAVVGAVGFVGLIAPHIARRWVGRTFGSISLAAGLIGALLVFIADVIARTAFYPIDIPAGVFTAAIGAPFFIYLLYQNRNRF